MALGKGIPVINGFDLNSKLPLDSRAVANTMEDMNKLVTDGSVGDGQLCYCKADKKLYVLKDNVWAEVGGGGGIPVIEGTKSTTTTDGAYATYTIPEAQTSCFIFKCDLGIAFISYNGVFGTYNGYLDAQGDVIDGSLKLDSLIVLSGSDTKIDIFFGNIGGSGGGGVSPVLVLSDSNLHARTTITKEEKTNIEKKLYNSVFYYDASFYSICLPEIVSYTSVGFVFSTCSISATNESNVVSGFNIYNLDISNNENEDGTYPITINKLFSLPLADTNSGVNIATIEIDRTPTRENTPISIIDTSMLRDDTQFVYIKDTSTNYKYMLCRVGNDFTSVWTDNISQGETMDCLYLHINGNNATLYHFNSKLGTVTFED